MPEDVSTLRLKCHEPVLPSNHQVQHKASALHQSRSPEEGSILATNLTAPSTFVSSNDLPDLLANLDRFKQPPAADPPRPQSFRCYSRRATQETNSDFRS